MKRIFCSLLITLITFSAIYSQDRVGRIRTKLLNRDDSSVIVASHRGDWRNFPENSVEAILSAVDMGVDIVEVDLQRTKDGTLILMHDPTIDRTTTGKGKVSEITIDSVRKVNLKNGCAIRTKHKVPTLEEALIAAKGKVMLNLDKADRYFDQVYSLLIATGTEKQVIMKGTKSAEEVKSLYGQYLDDIIYMPIVDLDKDSAKSQIELFMQELNPVAFEMLFRKDENPLPFVVKEKLEGKSLIWYNTLWDTMAGGHDDDMSLDDPDKGYGYLINTLGARLIQTDRPAYLIQYLRKNNLHD